MQFLVSLQRLDSLLITPPPSKRHSWVLLLGLSPPFRLLPSCQPLAACRIQILLPSWTLAPDMAGLDSVGLRGPWDTPPRLSNMPPCGLPLSFLHVTHFNASGLSSSVTEIHDSAHWSIGAENVLQLKGYILDSVHTRGDRWLHTARSQDRRVPDRRSHPRQC